MRIAFVIALLSACSLSLAAPAVALQPSLASGTVMEAAQRLKPGEYLWAPQVAPEGPVMIIVSLATQRAVVYRNGVPIGISTVSTGKAGHETPTGVFSILQKNKDHRSNLYDDAPMPFMQRLTWTGIALHAGQLPGHPASHGCIRLPYEFAKHLFGVTRLGLTVVVTDAVALPRIVSGATPLRLSAGVADTGYSWNPERSPSGPVSIVMSTSDRRMIVLRNGVEIGSSPFELDAEVDGTLAYALVASDAAGAHWVQLPLPGQESGRAVTPDDRRRFRAPSGFRSALAGIIRPGTTVVVTRDSLQRSAAGQAVELIAGEPHP